MKRVTIKDLAKMLNLSTSTVSRALSDHPDISQATKNRVRQAAEEFNYTTNVHARFFRKQHSGLIALILPEMNMFYTPNLIQGINKTIDQSKYSLITFITNDSYVKETEVINQCLGWAVEGVLISLSKETYNLKHLEKLTQANIKCVLLDKTIDNEQHPTITINNVDASYKGIAHLIENGHKNILGIFGSPNFSISRKRIKGYVRALTEKELPVPKENIISVDKSEDLDFILPAILNHNKKITAIFTMSDELLAKSLYHINALGVSVPEELSVLTISDGIYPYLTHPQVSHIKDSGNKMGRNACKLLIESIQSTEKDDPTRIFVPTKLVELQSVKSINTTILKH
ncbi:MAG: LacI family transcriptional regulator [Bacteroidetes bacterium]|nr:MAG: LacI family transcriptional regulator [Bacteroidota bacterium]